MQSSEMDLIMTATLNLKTALNLVTVTENALKESIQKTKINANVQLDEIN